MYGNNDLRAASAAVEAALDDLGDPSAVFARVGCKLADAQRVAQNRASSMLSVMYESATDVTDSDGNHISSADLVERAETGWLNGLLVGLYLAGPLDNIAIGDKALRSAIGSLNSTREQGHTGTLRGLGFDPSAAEARSLDIGQSVARTLELPATGSALDTAAALAGLWLDGLMTGAQARQNVAK